ncbi:Phosphate transport ATP-binding protein PstB [Hyalangium minutum]|uniref:Phosphate transport ATP-binding protein PstB n=2 Tax=Hyalangium minutum TaxID=394096 RepID=A0A085W3D1_9BACT|nr:Phosphate transport ATP-binding protein PstB [Hyalangium minutum]
MVHEEGGGFMSASVADCPAIRADKVSVRYGKALAFEDVSLEVSGGAITALVGPSGCGKTSFLSCINRLTDLYEGCVVSGQLTVGGESVLARGIDLLALRRQVGMISQRPNPFPLSIWRNLELPLREHGVGDRTERQQRIEQALRDVGLWDEVKDRLNRSAHALSGGQQQRLCIARALVLRPRVLLLDEPCSALDPISSGVVEDHVVQLRRRCTIVIVTHNLAQARRIADETAVFWTREGRGYLLESGPTARIFEAPQNPVTAAYIQGLRG